MDYPYEIKSIENIGSSKIFKLYSVGEKINYLPGQFVKLSLPNSDIGRPYSIASAPNYPYLEFLINMVNGRFTSILDKLKTGDKLNVSKASGHMTFRNEKNTVFIATGTGIAPIMSMIRHINENKIEGEHHLFYSAKTLDSTAYFNELKSLENQGIIKFHLFLTRELINGIEGGRISFEKIKEKLNNLNNYSFFICGKSDFTSDLLSKLLENNVLREKIKIEGWG